MTYYPSCSDRGPRLSQHVQEILHHRVGSGDDLGVRRIGLLGDDQLGEFVGDVGVGSLERGPDYGSTLAVQRLAGSVGRLEGAAIGTLEEVGAVEVGQRDFGEIKVSAVRVI